MSKQLDSNEIANLKKLLLSNDISNQELGMELLQQYPQHQADCFIELLLLNQITGSEDKEVALKMSARKAIDELSREKTVDETLWQHWKQLISYASSYSDSSIRRVTAALKELEKHLEDILSYIKHNRVFCTLVFEQIYELIDHLRHYSRSKKKEEIILNFRLSLQVPLMLSEGLSYKKTETWARHNADQLKGEQYTAIVDNLMQAAWQKGYAKELAWFYRGQIRFKNGLYQEALQVFQEALAIDPSQYGCQIYTALIHEDRQEYQQAKAIYLDLLQRYPRDSSVLNNLAYLEGHKLGNIEQGLVHSQKAVDLRRTANNSHTHGYMLWKKTPADLAGAKKYLRISSSMGNNVGSFHLAELFEAEGNAAMAKRYYLTCIKQEEDQERNEHQAEARERFEALKEKE